MLEFQQNEAQNQQKIVTLRNNKVAAISKAMELPRVISDLVLESKFLTLQKHSYFNMEIPGTMCFIPEGFELGMTLR